MIVFARAAPLASGVDPAFVCVSQRDRRPMIKAWRSAVGFCRQQPIRMRRLLSRPPKFAQGPRLRSSPSWDGLDRAQSRQCVRVDAGGIFDGDSQRPRTVSTSFAVSRCPLSRGFAARSAARTLCARIPLATRTVRRGRRLLRASPTNQPIRSWSRPRLRSGRRHR